MIFVTVGTQLPFDRLVRTVDQWVGSGGARHEVFAQIGPSAYRARHIRCSQFLDAEECHMKMTLADVVVAHAGMGSIITALELGKPIIVMPRRADLGEHRNDHQIATAQHLSRQGRIHVAFDERELTRLLGEVDDLVAGERITSVAQPQLLAALSQFLSTGALPAMQPAPATYAYARPSIQINAAGVQA